MTEGEDLIVRISFNHDLQEVQLLGVDPNVVDTVILQQAAFSFFDWISKSEEVMKLARQRYGTEH